MKKVKLALQVAEMQFNFYHPLKTHNTLKLRFWFSHLQVIEPNIGKGGETIAILPIKVSVKSVFSRLRLDSYSLSCYNPH